MFSSGLHFLWGYVEIEDRWNKKSLGRSASKNWILKPLEILHLPQKLSLYQQMLIMQILTQTDNHKYRKNVATKKVFFKKNGCKVSKP